MSGILSILVPILNAGATGGAPDPWPTFIFNDNEATVAFTVDPNTFTFNCNNPVQEF